MLYLDPGSGSIVLQVALAAVVAAGIFVKRWWTTLISTLRHALTSFRRQP
jgi:hypothetical protein